MYNTAKAAVNPETYSNLGKTARAAAYHAMDKPVSDEDIAASANTVGTLMDAAFARTGAKKLLKGIDNVSKGIRARQGLDDAYTDQYLHELTGLPKGANADIGKDAWKDISKNAINKILGNAKGTPDDVKAVINQNQVGRGNPFAVNIGDNLKYYTDIQNNTLYPPKKFNEILSGQSGRTDLPPAFNKQLQLLMSDLKHLPVQKQFGKRPLERVAKPEAPYFSISAAEAFNDDARYELGEGINNLIMKNVLKGAKPFDTKKAFANLSPNKYGGSPRGWLDELY